MIDTKCVLLESSLQEKSGRKITLQAQCATNNALIAKPEEKMELDSVTCEVL
jgi:hypothetical protein